MPFPYVDTWKIFSDILGRKILLNVLQWYVFFSIPIFQTKLSWCKRVVGLFLLQSSKQNALFKITWFRCIKRFGAERIIKDIKPNARMRSSGAYECDDPWCTSIWNALGSHDKWTHSSPISSQRLIDCCPDHAPWSGSKSTEPSSHPDALPARAVKGPLPWRQQQRPSATLRF